MIAPFLAVFALAAAPVAPPPFVANGAEAEGALLHIGDTGIRCVRLPCPSRAVFEPDAQDGAATRERMLYVDLEGSLPPPPMIGSEADLSAIRDAWEERHCLAVYGRLVPGEEDRPLLRVDRVIGPCGHR